MRYVEHKKQVYLVTLNQKWSVERIGEGVVVTLSFDGFLEDAEEYIGVKLDRDKYNKALSSYLEAGMQTYL